SVAVRVTRATDVAVIFAEARKRYGTPASVLTDNGCIFTARHRGGKVVLETELERLGVAHKHSRPYHPQTCGKVERFHQTLKTFLHRQPAPTSVAELQEQVDRFTRIYNEVRPHRARGRCTPKAAFDARDKARPEGPQIKVSNETRVRRDKVDAHGVMTIRYRSKLHHIGLGRDFAGTRVIVLVDGLDIRVLRENGELLRELTLDPDK